MLLLLRFLCCLRFFLKIQKKRDFYVFCLASHVFSNYGQENNNNILHLHDDRQSFLVLITVNDLYNVGMIEQCHHLKLGHQFFLH